MSFFPFLRRGSYKSPATSAVEGEQTPETGKVDTEKPRTTPETRSNSKSEATNESESSTQDAGITSTSTTSFNDLDSSSLSMILSFTSPADVSRVASVSKSFKEAAESNIVWASFLPAGISQLMKDNNCLTDDLLLGHSETLKLRDVFRGLSKGILIEEGKQKMEVSKASGDFALHVSVVENLNVVWGDHKQYWWMESEIPGSAFPRTAHLLNVCWFQIGGRIQCRLPLGRYTCAWRLARDSVYNVLNVRRGRGIPMLALPGPGLARGTTFRWNNDKADSKITCYRDGDVTGTTEVEIDITTYAISECSRGEWTEVAVGEITIEREEKTESGIGLLDVGVELVETKDGNWKSGLYVDSFVVRALRA